MPLWGQMAFGAIFGFAALPSVVLIALRLSILAIFALILFSASAFYIHFKWDWRGFYIGILIVFAFVAAASCLIITGP
jgi:hypothetical protein